MVNMILYPSTSGHIPTVILCHWLTAGRLSVCVRVGPDVEVTSDNPVEQDPGLGHGAGCMLPKYVMISYLMISMMALTKIVL